MAKEMAKCVTSRERNGTFSKFLHCGHAPVAPVCTRHINGPDNLCVITIDWAEVAAS
jgi:hypothetical protein